MKPLDERPNLYQVLGVNPEANYESIRAAWRLAARKNHPDRYDYDDREQIAQAEERMRNVTLAWATLSDEHKRRLYDLQIGLKEARCSRCGSMGRLRLGQDGQVVGLCNSCYSPHVTIL
jgi:DnaJ-class molecular chaperone